MSIELIATSANTYHKNKGMDIQNLEYCLQFKFMQKLYYQLYRL